MSWCLLALLLSCDLDATGVREGQVAPAFEASTLAGQTLALSDLRGQPAVIAFWASWCGPCREEVPELNKVAGFYEGRVRVLGINQGEDTATVLRAVSELDMAYDTLVDPDGGLGLAFEVSSIPLVLVLDAEGRIRYRGNGLPSQLLQLLDALGG